MRIAMIVPALAATLLAGTAIAQDVAPNSIATEVEGGSSEAPKPKKKKERKICRESNQTYSRMPVRDCRTAAQWEAHDAKASQQGNSGLSDKAN